MGNEILSYVLESEESLFSFGDETFGMKKKKKKKKQKKKNVSFSRLVSLFIIVLREVRRQMDISTLIHVSVEWWRNRRQRTPPVSPVSGYKWLYNSQQFTYII